MYKILIITLTLIISLNAYEESKGTVGYGRVQTSFQDDKENTCFKLSGAQTKYRLGNECETWLELGIFQDIKFDNGIVVHNQVRSSYVGENEASIDFLRWEEAYSEIFNLVDSNSVSFWLGRRYYKRYDSQISDYFLFNMSGSGLGVDNYRVFNGITLSYSYMFDDLEHDTFVDGESLRFHSHDIRFEKKDDDSELTFFINYMNFSSESFSSAGEIKSADGYALGLLYKSKNIDLFGMSGENVAAVFYGDGAAKAAGQKSSFLQDDIVDTMITNSTTIDEANRVRFINYNDFENGTFGIMTNLVYEIKDEKEIDDFWLS
jgi:maltoporin